MADGTDVLESPAETDAANLQSSPIESRFLFVDVASMRAKQLRRGALPRLTDQDDLHDPHRAAPFKAERIAMEEVRRGLVPYDIGHDRPAI